MKGVNIHLLCRETDQLSMISPSGTSSFSLVVDLPLFDTEADTSGSLLAMFFSPVVGLLLASLVLTVVSQQDMAMVQQTLIGTWSSGSQHVVTGPGFANPVNMSFTYPSTTGISYSFT